MERKILIDDYEHLSDDIEYILENILQDDDGSDEFNALRDIFNSNIERNCECEKCEDECLHGGNYEIRDGELLLRDDRRCKDLIYECHDSCNCTTCLNKLVQFGPRDDLKIQHFTSKGLGLVSTSHVKKGSFICEYAGEILTKFEAMKRDKINQKEKKMNYIFCLNEIGSEKSSSTIQTFIDPSRKGNIGRYINHSCDANCDIISTRVDSIIPKIAIFANREIPPLTEITFNYGPEGLQVSFDPKKSCNCNSYNCRLYLPNFSF
jgi:[histone H3]-lysine36 N-dimethyltransferase SETMAR